MKKNVWHKISDVDDPEAGDPILGWNIDTEIWYGELFFDDDDEKFYGDNGEVNAGYDKPPTHFLIQRDIPSPPTNK